MTEKLDFFSKKKNIVQTPKIKLTALYHKSQKPPPNPHFDLGEVGGGGLLVINGGEIIEKGTHEELLDQQGFYHHLYVSQFKGQAI